jgi:hypothetical protein
MGAFPFFLEDLWEASSSFSLQELVLGLEEGWLTWIMKGDESFFFLSEDIKGPWSSLGSL